MKKRLLLSGGAAKVCNEYTTTVNGIIYSDWFLPSKDELNQMYEHKATINTTAAANSGSNFANNYYWSSTESVSNIAWLQDFFYDGSQFNVSKSTASAVRAVRAF